MAHTDMPFAKFDLGPELYLQLLDTTSFPPNATNDLENSGWKWGAIRLTRSTGFAEQYLAPSLLIGPFSEPDPDNTWHNICGYMLTEKDGFGTESYTGYNLIWQYRISSVTPSVAVPGAIATYHYYIRIIKQHFQNPLDMAVIYDWNSSTPIGGAKCYLSIVCVMYNEEGHWFMGIGVGGSTLSTQLNPYACSFSTVAIGAEYFETYHYVNPFVTTNDENELDPEGPSKPGGGGGTHNRKTEAVTLPDLPALGGLDAGMITLYRLTGPEMTSFTSELWTFWSAVKAFFADPLDFVIGCMIVPFTPESTRQARPKFGADVWNTAFDVISEQFYSISCGTIDIEKYYGSCFDYDPYRKLEIYIPYVGYRELPVDQIMGKTIELTYHIDCMSGDFVAFVHTPVVGPTGPQLAQIICQFAGTMGVHVPLSRESFDSMVSAGINLLGGAVGMAAGGIAQAAGLEGGDLKASQIASQASSATVTAVNAMKRNVIRSGSIGASSGMLAKQNPFIISTLPRQSLPENYKELEGYPSNIYGTVGSFSGYLAVETIKLQVSATNTEREMILSMLKGGIFV